MNKSCFDIFPILQRKRLFLRAINSLDVEGIFEVFSDPDVANYD